MERYNDLFLNKAIPFAKGAGQTLDPGTGGMFGYYPDSRLLLSGQGYVRRNLIPVTIDVPKIIKNHPYSNELVRIHRNIMEVRPYSITGFQRGLEVSREYIDAGHGGEKMPHVTDVKQTQTQLQITFYEVYMQAIQNYFRFWIQTMIMDQNTKMPTILNYMDTSIMPTDLLFDQYSSSMLYLEPDPTGQYVVNAWLGVGIIPSGTDQWTGSREPANAMQLVQFNIQFDGIFDSGNGVKELAQEIWDRYKVNLRGANPSFARPAYDRMSADVEAIKAGYEQTISDVRDSAVAGRP